MSELPEGKKVLLVIDDTDLLDLVSSTLGRNGFDVTDLDRADRALETAGNERPDIVLLDLTKPGVDRMAIAKELKSDKRTARVPLMMLTEKHNEAEIVTGLALGADDYITKPFSMAILLARIGALLRRLEGTAAPSGDDDAETRSEILRAGPLSIDVSKHEVSLDGKPLKITLTEMKLLAALINARGHVLSRDQLMDKAMGSDVFVTDRAIDVHITAIRKKLGSASWLIKTVRGVGYQLGEEKDE